MLHENWNTLLVLPHTLFNTAHYITLQNTKTLQYNYITLYTVYYTLHATEQFDIFPLLQVGDQSILTNIFVSLKYILVQLSPQPLQMPCRG